MNSHNRTEPKVNSNPYIYNFKNYLGFTLYILYIFTLYTWTFLRRADHLSRGVLPTVVRRRVWSRNLKNDEAMTRVGSQRHRKKTTTITTTTTWTL